MGPVPDTGKDHPFVIIVGKFPRMAVSCEVVGETVQSALDFLRRRWVDIFGRPSLLITDNGSNSKGELFAAFGGVWNITHICNPAYSAYQGGVFERADGVLMAGVPAVANRDPSTQRIDAVSLAVDGWDLYRLSECGLPHLAITSAGRHILDWARFRRR